MKAQYVSSSNLDVVGYHRGNLIARFMSGAVYEYSKVPIRVFHEIVNAESPGVVFNVMVKGTYEYKKLTYDPFNHREAA